MFLVYFSLLCLHSPSSRFHPKRCVRFWFFPIPFCACVLCIHLLGRTMFCSWLFIQEDSPMQGSFFLIEQAQQERACVATCFCKCFSFSKTLFVVLQRHPELQSIMRPYYFVYQIEACVVVSHCGCCVYILFGLWFGLGVGNVVWTSLIKLVWEGTSQTNLGGWFSSLYTLYNTGMEGIAWGTV